MALAQSTLIQRVRDVLGDNPWQTQATATGTGNIFVTDGTRWDEGALLEWQDTGELDWVQSVVTNTVTAIRGINGTTATTHSGTQVVYRDPFFQYRMVREAIELTIQSMWPYAYKKVSMSITYDATKTFYDTSASLMEVIQVSQPRNSQTMAYIYGAGSSPVIKNLPTATVSSGIGIAFPNGWAITNQDIQLDFAAKLTTTQTTTGTYSDIQDGLMAECITFGAAARMVMNTEVTRVTQEDIGMGDSSVQPGARMRSGQLLWQVFLDKRRLLQQEFHRNIPLRSNDSPMPYNTGRMTGYGYNTTPPWA